jgi:hypothetical protein
MDSKHRRSTQRLIDADLFRKLLIGKFHFSNRNDAFVNGVEYG